MNRDIHPDLGERVRVASFEAIAAVVHACWPGAYAEGSTGSERSWWIADPGGPVLVAHSWPLKGGDSFWLRTACRRD